MRYRWIPALVLAFGAFLTLGAAKQRALPLERSIAEVIPTQILGYSAQDLTISDVEAEVAGFSNYLFRLYETSPPDPPEPMEGQQEDVSATPTGFSLYVGYYESQTQGNTIHSPRNCLPGAGWEPLSSDPVLLNLDGTPLTLNRYLLQNGPERALVLYWYQGRGRVAHDEYRVKLDLLRDAALRRRSDEALVRIVVLVGTDEETALELALGAAAVVIPKLDQALPGL
jgi:EpsI family protein